MTQKALMLLPMVILIFFTFGIMFWMLKLRYKAVAKDNFDPKYFRLYDASQSSVPMPEYLAKVTQHFQNLLEMPPLFYLALIFLAAMNITDMFYVILAWAFLFARFLHCYIHTTGNRVMKRKNAFIISLIILMILWARIAIEIVSL